MIDMSKKYRTRNGRDVRLLCVDGPSDKYPVYGFAGADLLTWSIEGAERNEPGPSDLIEAVPEVVRYRAVYPGGEQGAPYDQINSVKTVINGASASAVAILKTTIRNGGVNGPSDVSVDVLPVDYKETP